MINTYKQQKQQETTSIYTATKAIEHVILMSQLQERMMAGSKLESCFCVGVLKLETDSFHEVTEPW